MAEDQETYATMSMTLANKITIIRILLIPVFIITLMQGMAPWPAVIFTCTIITDALDGFVARYRGQTTRLGSFLDPLADKLLMFASFLLAATYLKIIPLWVFTVILSRDLMILLGWIVIYFVNGSTEIKPRMLGKTTTAVQMLTVWVMLLNVAPRYFNTLLMATVVVTALSAIDYVIAGTKRL